jgi:hypothetical protein
MRPIEYIRINFQRESTTADARVDLSIVPFCLT